MPKTYKVSIATVTPYEITVTATDPLDAEYKAESLILANKAEPEICRITVKGSTEVRHFIDDIDGETPFCVAVTYKRVQDGHGNSYPKILACDLTVFHDEDRTIEAFQRVVDPCDALTLVDIAHHSNIADYSYDDVATLTHNNNQQ